MNEENIDKTLDTKEWFIDDEVGNLIGDLSLVSFVRNPWHQGDYKTFSANKYVFAQANEEQRLVIGPAMRANFVSLSQDPFTGEYYNGFFSPETIKTASEIYLKNCNHTQTNLEHGEVMTKNEVEGVSVVQSWLITDPQNDKANALGFKELEVGDWYIGYLIENDKFWEFFKENKGGFSIEGMFADAFSSKFSKLTDAQIEKRIKEITFSKDLTDNQKEKQIKILLCIK